jgi:hypothetical protein
MSESPHDENGQPESLVSLLLCVFFFVQTFR